MSEDQDVSHIQRLEQRIALLERLIVSLMIHRNDPHKRGWVREIFKNEFATKHARPYEPEQFDWLSGLSQSTISDKTFDDLEQFGAELTNAEMLAIDIAQLREENAEVMTAFSEAKELANVPFPRMVKASVYVSSDDPDDAKLVESGLRDLLIGIGADLYASGTPKSGSWGRDMWGRIRELVTGKEVQDRVAKVERALELRGIDIPQADADAKLARGAKDLLKGLEKSETALALIGDLLVMKDDGKTVVLQLTQDQLARVRNNEGCLMNVSSMMLVISGASESTDRLSGNSSALDLDVEAVIAARTQKPPKTRKQISVVSSQGTHSPHKPTTSKRIASPTRGSGTAD